MPSSIAISKFVFPSSNAAGDVLFGLSFRQYAISGYEKTSKYVFKVVSISPTELFPSFPTNPANLSITTPIIFPLASSTISASSLSNGLLINICIDSRNSTPCLM